MHATDPIDLGQHRTARACAKPTTAGVPWADRHAVRTDSHPGPRQVTEADVLALRDPEFARIHAARVADERLAEAIDGMLR